MFLAGETARGSATSDEQASSRRWEVRPPVLRRLAQPRRPRLRLWQWREAQRPQRSSTSIEWCPSLFWRRPSSASRFGVPGLRQRWEALDGRDVTGAESGKKACTSLMVSTILYASFAQTDGNLHSQTPGHDSQRSWSAYSQRGLHGKLLSSPTIGMNREVDASASTPGVEELGSLGAANASTLGPTSAGTTIDAAEQMMHEAEEASLRSFHEFTSYWTNERVNVRSSTQAGMFEMVLQSTLRQELVSVLTKFENYTCF